MLAPPPDLRDTRRILKLLRQIDAMSASRDREQMTLRLIMAVRDVLNASGVQLFAVTASPNGPVGALVAEADSAGERLCLEEDAQPPRPLLDDPLLATAIRASGLAHEDQSAAGHRFAFAIGKDGIPHALLIAVCAHPIDARLRQAASHVAHFYQNQLDLLDYAELDTLTKLLNRKTFDENFDRFVTRAGRSVGVPQDRRSECEGEERPSWLAVVDIDHFKHINDRFGHLFGDEVLLRIAELMKKSFRQCDKLFRFGGEEFVVLLRNVSARDAKDIFDRFRSAIEGHDFPQLGGVTASVGYTRIDPSKPPAEILGHADEALYYSKEHGRNQVQCYETLLADGRMAFGRQGDSSTLQAAIDLLFGSDSPIPKGAGPR